MRLNQDGGNGELKVPPVQLSTLQAVVVGILCVDPSLGSSIEEQVPEGISSYSDAIRTGDISDLLENGGIQKIDHRESLAEAVIRHYIRELKIADAQRSLGRILGLAAKKLDAKQDAEQELSTIRAIINSMYPEDNDIEPEEEEVLPPQPKRVGRRK